MSHNGIIYRQFITFIACKAGIGFANNKIDIF